MSAATSPATRTFRIGKRFSFEGGHYLETLPADHKCRQQHGHSYSVEVVLASTRLTGPGWVADFGSLAPFGRYLKEHLDHRNLNEVVDFEPTCEQLAAHLAEWFQQHLQPHLLPARLVKVRVSETAGTWAEVILEAAA